VDLGECAAVQYYRRDLAYVHHRGFGFHADACAPGILAFLEPVRASGGLVVELGCGTGLLTRYLVDAGHRVIATDASPAMLEIARDYVPGAEIRSLVLPDDAIPATDAIVSVGHALNYLPDEPAVESALAAIAGALHPGGLLAFDVCDLEWGVARGGAPNYSWVGDDWAIVTRFSLPSPDRFVRDITTFVRSPDGSWRRDDEVHANVLLDTARLPALLAEHDVESSVGASFGDEPLLPGLRVVLGRRAG
jgi:SAM-dependent methyltransferase